MGMMHQPVEDGVSEGGIADHLVPVLDRQLTRHERGAPSGPILDKLDGERCSACAIAQIESSVASPQEISLRSSSVTSLSVTP